MAIRFRLAFTISSIFTIALGVIYPKPAASTSVLREFYFENFDHVPGFRINNAGFTGQFWKLGTDGPNKFLESIPPAMFAKESKATTPTFHVSRNFAVQYQLRFPGTWEGTSPGETSVDLHGQSGHSLFTLVFLPNAPASSDADNNHDNLILLNRRTRERNTASTGTVTPFGQDADAGTVNLKIAFFMTSSGGTRVEVSYGENGSYWDAPLIVHEFQGPVSVDSLTFRHRPGGGMRNELVQVDNIAVRPSERILFPALANDAFARELRTSNGSNTSDVFDATSYFQGTF